MFSKCSHGLPPTGTTEAGLCCSSAANWRQQSLVARLQGRLGCGRLHDLAWGQIMGRGWIESYGMYQLADAIRDIRTLMQEWKGTGNAMRVLAYSGEEHDRQRRERFERITREQLEREQPGGEQPREA